MIIIASRSIPAAQPTAGVCGPPSVSTKPIVAAAGDDRALRAQAICDEFEDRVAVIIEPADQPLVDLVSDPGRVEPGAHGGEKLLGFGRQDHFRRAVGRGPVLGVLAVEDAEGILGQPFLAVGRQFAAMLFEMLDEPRAPRFAALGIAKRVAA